jgi:hypothetical protein
MSGELRGWILAHAPSGEAHWQHGEQTYVSTGDELWQTSENARMWPVQDVNALVADAAAVLVRSEGGRQRLDREPMTGRSRQGLHQTAHWTRAGWQIEGLALPYGARWSSSLMPTATGFGAVWMTEGQHFECTALGVRAVRDRNEGWWPRADTTAQSWATAQAGHQLWGPGGRLWNLQTGESQLLPEWTGGIAGAQGSTAFVVNALTGDGLEFHNADVVRRFTVPLRRDMAAVIGWDERGPVLLTELGKQFALGDGDVRKLPGRQVPEHGDVMGLDDLGIVVDGVIRVDDADWAWRQDGLLLRRV